MSTARSTDYSEILKNMESACDIVVAFQLEHWNQIGDEVVSDKSHNQLVSFVDQESEKTLVERLTKALPGSTIIGEESASNNREITEYTWVIDPLDGTTNYLHGLPVFSISIALLHEGVPVIAIVDCPALNERFTAIKGNGAKLNGKDFSVATNTELTHSLLATGFPYHDFAEMDSYLEVLTYFMKHTRGLRRMGSAAIDLAYTACGRFDAFFELHLSPWDVAAGVLLVREAGGIVTTFEGNDEVIFADNILASSSSLYPSIKKSVQQAFND